MPIIAKKTGQVHDPAPPGAHPAVCVDVVDMGIVKVSYAGEEKKQHKIRIVWQIAEENPKTKKPFEVSKRYTLSLHEKSGLRKELEAWRGRAFTDEELQGWDVEQVIGVPCLLSVVHQKNQSGKTWANINSIMRLPKGMEAPRQREYVRVKDRKEDEGVAQPDQYIPSDDDVPF